ncbi:WXG100 family type VII secretion target [Nocardioides acrostichi]|uniref:ESAT-6-like protein n=1 Tax=Nocardioides acrostichi TaxID=2784339 RepID=A0A930V4F3_9ACTN|nr:WXG100 family type VII secretion target [Nocardioides acrostichi]MBF4163545.1 WXG100 family type VII secretion target [Nocardioides acrostichi]
MTSFDDASGIRVNHAGLQAGAQDLTTAVRAIEGRLARLDGELAPLRAQWAGSAQEAYQRAKAQWDQAIAEMKGLLARTSAAVAQADQDYRAADARGAALFGG